MLTRSQRDRWAAALRSGKYAQTRYTFREPGKYCCLAVLCECEDVDTSGVDTSNVDNSFIAGYRVANALLSPDVVQRFMNYNDSDELTFPQIAERVDALPVVEANDA